MLARLLVLIGLLFMPAIAHAQDPNAVIKRIQSSGVLKVPVIPGAEPGYIRNSDGSWKGYYVDWLQDVAKLLNVKLQFHETTWGNLTADFQANKIDMFFGTNPNPARALVIDEINAPYHSSLWAVLTRPGLTINSWAELNKPTMRIGAMRGVSDQLVAEAMAPDAKYTLMANMDQLVLEMRAGRLDAIVLVDRFAVKIKADFPDAIGEAVVPTPVLENPAGAAVKREPGNEGFKTFLASWMTRQRVNGFSQASLNKYYKELGIDLTAIRRP